MDKIISALSFLSFAIALVFSGCVQETNPRPDGVVVIGNGADPTQTDKILVADVKGIRGNESLSVTKVGAQPFLADSKINSQPSTLENVSATTVTKAPAVEVEWLVADDPASVLFKLKNPLEVIEKNPDQTTTESSHRFFRKSKITGNLFWEQKMESLQENHGISEPRFMKDRSFYYIDSVNTLHYSHGAQSFNVLKNVDSFYLERKGNLLVRNLDNHWQLIKASKLASWNGNDNIATEELGRDILIYQNAELDIRLLNLNKENSGQWNLNKLYTFNPDSENFDQVSEFKISDGTYLMHFDSKAIAVTGDRAIFTGTRWTNNNTTVNTLFELSSKSLRSIYDFPGSSTSLAVPISLSSTYSLYSDDSHIVLVDEASTAASNGLSAHLCANSMTASLANSSETKDTATTDGFAHWKCNAIQFQAGYQVRHAIFSKGEIIVGAEKGSANTDSQNKWVVAYLDPDSNLKLQSEVTVDEASIAKLRLMSTRPSDVELSKDLENKSRL